METLSQKIRWQMQNFRVNNRPPQIGPQYIAYEEHQRILNQFKEQCNVHQQQIISLQASLQSTNKEYELVRKHYIETETKLQNMSKKYRDIIPETLCNNNDRGSVGWRKKDRILEYIKILLFCHEGYS